MKAKPPSGNSPNPVIAARADKVAKDAKDKVKGSAINNRPRTDQVRTTDANKNGMAQKAILTGGKSKVDVGMQGQQKKSGKGAASAKDLAGERIKKDKDILSGKKKVPEAGKNSQKDRVQRAKEKERRKGGKRIDELERQINELKNSANDGNTNSTDRDDLIRRIEELETDRDNAVNNELVDEPPITDPTFESDPTQGWDDSGWRDASSSGKSDDPYDAYAGVNDQGGSDEKYNQLQSRFDELSSQLKQIGSKDYDGTDDPGSDASGAYEAKLKEVLDSYQKQFEALLKKNEEDDGVEAGQYQAFKDWQSQESEYGLQTLRGGGQGRGSSPFSGSYSLTSGTSSYQSGRAGRGSGSGSMVLGSYGSSGASGESSNGRLSGGAPASSYYSRRFGG